MSRNTQAFSISLLANDGKFKEAAQHIAAAKSPAEGALLLAQVYREIDITKADRVEQALKEQCA